MKTNVNNEKWMSFYHVDLKISSSFHRLYLVFSIFSLLYLGGVKSIFGQQSKSPSSEILHEVYMVGNAADLKKHPEFIDAISNIIRASGTPSTVIYTGDVIGKNGLEKPNRYMDSVHLQKLLSLESSELKTKVHILTGDRDWDNSGKSGWKKMKELEKFVEKKLGYKGVIKPSKGCPGPSHIDLDPHLRLVLLNTQWLLHPHEVPIAPATACQVLTEEDFWEELEDLIDHSEDMNILIAGHHPIYSNGQYGGKQMWKKHLFPLTDAVDNLYIPLPGVGTFYASYRQNVGTPRDMSSEKYANFRATFEEMLYDYHPLIYIAGHEYNMELVLKEHNYHFNSGSSGKTKPAGKSAETIFKKSTKGFARIRYYADGKVSSQFFAVENGTANSIFDQVIYQSACDNMKADGIPINESFMPCKVESVRTDRMNDAYRDSSRLVIAGEEYKASKFRSLWLGKHYRDSWTVAARVPYLDLDHTFGGLTPFELGGGRQTTSLKFNAGNGNEYVFRSVNKNPVKALPHGLRGTVVETVLKDQTTTQHPYGALIVSKMLDATDILHARPELFILPDDLKLGQWKYLGNLYGMLEDRPKGPSKSNPGFEGSDDVDRSFKMFRKVYNDNDNAINPEAFAKARVFDILIGDWGRHEDNWKWAGYKNGKGLTFYPIPRDRDHAFSRWDGVLPWIADREWARPNTENFRHEFKINGIRSLTWPARHLDRLVGTELSKDDWIAAVDYIQLTMTDQVIEEAVKELPEADYAISGNELESKLKSRRDQLEKATSQYYKLLSKQVDVVGSNKREVFEVSRLENGDVKVEFYKKKNDDGGKGALKYQRVFKKSETKEIRLFGLAGKDDFNLNGTSNSSILIRVIGGEDKDKVLDKSFVKGIRRMTVIYDSKEEDMITAGKESKYLTPKTLVDYDRKAFKYNTYLPLPIISYSGDDGFGFGIGVSWTMYKFLKTQYASKHNMSVSGSTRGTLSLNYTGLYKEVFGKADFRLNIDAGAPVREYPDFYGIGNETSKVDSLFRENYYQVNQNKISIEPSIIINFFQKSNFNIGLNFEYSDVQVDDIENGGIDRFLQTQTGLRGLDDNQFAGASFGFNIDLRDRTYYTLNGLHLFLKHTSYLDLSDGAARLGKTKAHIAVYQTANIGIPVTFAVKGGIADVYGEVPFYKLSTLGQTENLRGYFRNRFAGHTAAYLNSEVRLQVAEISTAILPIKIGLLGFYDLGRVWLDGATGGSEEIRHGYGGGLFLIPYEERFTFNISVAHSKEESVLLKLGLGFLIQ